MPPNLSNSVTGFLFQSKISACCFVYITNSNRREHESFFANTTLADDGGDRSYVFRRRSFRRKVSFDLGLNYSNFHRAF